MAETLANGTTIPQGSDPIHSSGVQAMRNMGGSVDGQLGNRYTKAQADALLAGKSPVGHTHDDRYYTEAEIDAQIAAAVSGLTWSTGWQVVGNRDGVTGTISVSRSAAAGGDLTTVRLRDVLPPAGAGSIYLATLPAGFRHDGEHFFIASNRAAPRFSLLGVYGNSVAWVQLADGTVNHPTLPISGEYSWRSPDARPAI